MGGHRHIVGVAAFGLIAVGMLVFYMSPAARFGWFASDVERSTGLYVVDAAPTGDVLWTWQQGTGALFVVAGLILGAALAGYSAGRRRPTDGR